MSKLCIILLLAVSSVLLFAQSVHSAKPPAKRSGNPPKSKKSYILQGFDKKKVLEVKNGSETYDECWKEPKLYEVCVTKTPGAEYLTWSNEELAFKVLAKKYESGSFSIRFLFKDGGIDLYKGASGKITQIWELPNTTWEYTKLADGTVDEEWTGKKDEKALKYYKSVIDAWCAVNDFYMGKENCAIY